MAQNEKPKSIFFQIADALSGNKRNLDDILAKKEKDLITGVPPSPFNTSSDNIEQRQQDYLDIQSVKIAQDLYARTVYYDADRISSYNDYRAMDQSPEISVALDIMADECIEASTIIPLLSGEKLTVEDLFNQKRSSFWVYSYNTEKKCIEPAICEKIVYKGEQEVYEVTFDDDSSIMVTDKHMWLTKEGKLYKQTNELNIGDSIQPFYSRISTESDRIKGYEMLLEDNGKWEYTHRIVKRKLFNEQKGVCHHKDFIKTNNEPNNLQVMNYFEHQKLHAGLNSKRWENEVYANKMKKIFSETNSKNGPYWSNEEWSSRRKKQAKEHMINYMQTLNEDEKKNKFGLHGEKNGMYNNGQKLVGEKNGRFLHQLNHEFNEHDIIEAYKSSNNIDEACILLNTNKVILRKSKAYKSLKLDRWEDLNILINELSLEKVSNICKKYESKLILERNAAKICKELGVKPKIVYKFLQKQGYKNWCTFVKQFNSRNKIIHELKKLFLTTQPKSNGKVSLRYFCEKNNQHPKQIEGIITRSQHKTWSNFVESINHSIKCIKLVGVRKTYDLVNVTDNNNYAVLTANGTGVFVHNCVARSDKGEILTIYSENERIKNVLNTLFQQTLNVDLNLWFWIRELLKYGDNFLKLEVHRETGVYDVVQMPTGEIHKEIGVDGNPKKIRYKWDNTSGMYFEDFEIAHFSLISDGMKLPYGRSVLDPARKLWKQLQLAEDAMLVYRIIRAPERRIFYLDVGNSDPADIKQYIDSMKRELKKQPVVDARTGNINLKYNPITYEEDYFIPVRNGVNSRVDTLPGACLSLDTKICLLDGRTVPLSEIIKEYEEGKQLETYSINPKTGEIVPGKITWAGITRKNTNVVKITLDNNESIIVTPDHKFPTRFNGIKEAKDLQVGESMWSFNKKYEKIKGAGKKRKRNTYEMIFDHSKNNWIYTHRLVANYLKSFNIHEEFSYLNEYKNANKKTIHHKNFNRYNNSINNLCFMNSIDHFYYHQDNMKNLIDFFGKEKIEEWKENRRNGLKKYFRELSEQELKIKKDTAINNSLKSRKKSSDTFKKNPDKESIILRTSSKSRITKNKHENKKIYSKNSKKLWKNSSYIESVIAPQRIKYNERMISILSDLIKEGKINTKDILPIINNSEHEFYQLFYNGENKNNQQLKKSKNITHNNLDKTVKYFGYNNWRDFKSKANCFNHKVVSIEFLSDKIDTGTITVDGNEEFHNYHNFALDCGIFTQNSNLDAIADIEYLQNKLFTAIKVPKAYLNYAEGLPGGKTLSQADLRFSRTINRIQELVIMELRRIANIHLLFLGFDGDVDNFTLTLTNPSTQQEIMKLETWKMRLDVFKEMFSSDATSPVSYTWAMEFLLGFSQKEIKHILRQKKIERKMFYEIERAHLEYMDTGVFTDMDRKFRKADFDPNTDIDPEEEGGGESGGGDGGFGGGSSLGGMDLGGGDMDLGGGDGDMSGLDAQPGSEGAPSGAELTTSDSSSENPEDNLNESNLLLRRNKIFNFRTKMLAENIDKYLHDFPNNDDPKNPDELNNQVL